jgi:hypothetical protein
MEPTLQKTLRKFEHVYYCCMVYWRHLPYTADVESLKFKTQGYGGSLKLEATKMNIP